MQIFKRADSGRRRNVRIDSVGASPKGCGRQWVGLRDGSTSTWAHRQGRELDRCPKDANQGLLQQPFTREEGEKKFKEVEEQVKSVLTEEQKAKYEKILQPKPASGKKRGGPRGGNKDND